ARRAWLAADLGHRDRPHRPDCRLVCTKRGRLPRLREADGETPAVRTHKARPPRASHARDPCYSGARATVPTRTKGVAMSRTVHRPPFSFGHCSLDYRPWLEALEPRLPPGDALCGLFISWPESAPGIAGLDSADKLEIGSTKSEVKRKHKIETSKQEFAVSASDHSGDETSLGFRIPD